MEVCRRTLRVYLAFVKSEIHRAVVYRVSYLSYILGDILQIAISYYLWSAIFSSNSKSIINGFTKNEMIIYIIMSFITSMVISSDTEWIIEGEVQSGEISINLIRPINYQLRLMAKAIGVFAWKFVIMFLPIWVCMIGIRFFTLGATPPNMIIITTYLISLIFSFTIWFLFNFCFGLISFFVTYLWGLNVFKNTIVKFISGGVVPLIFFPVWFQKILRFLPFGSVNYTPVMIYLNKYNMYETVKVLGIQIMWIIVLYLFSNYFWSKTIKKLEIMGG